MSNGFLAFAAAPCRSFDRTVKKIRTITRLYDKLEAARKTRGVVVTTPEALKSLMLKHLELLHSLEEAPGTTPRL